MNLASIIQDFQSNVWLYLLIPVISGLVGYITKVVAVQMMFRPIEFFGIKPIFGWQGIVPRKAEKMATIAVELMTTKLIRPEEIFARLDPQRIAAEIERPLLDAAEDITRQVAQQQHPGLWESMPQFMRQRIINRVKREAPRMVEQIMAEVQQDVGRFFDIRHMVVSNLTRDKKLLNEIFLKVGRQEFKFFSTVGFWFGLGIGLIQMGFWLFFKQPWMLPVFGGFVGFFSDWLALQMLFRPQHPKKILGFTFQGLFLKRQQEVARDYAELISKQLLTPGLMIEDLFTGPRSNAVLDILQRYIREMVDQQAGLARPLVVMAVGGQGYMQMKVSIADAVMQRMPDTMKMMESYAADAMRIRETLVDRMQLLTPEEFEGMLRPAFKEDEWILIMVGGILGVVVGELQIHLMLPLFH